MSEIKCNYTPPQEVIDAARLVEHWFARKGIEDWKLCGVQNRVDAEREPVSWQWLHHHSFTGAPMWMGEPIWMGRKSEVKRPLYLDPPPTSELEAEIARLRFAYNTVTSGALIAAKRAEDAEARLAEALKALEPFADARMIARLEAENREGISNFGTACCVSVPTVIGCLYDARRVREGGKVDG